MNSAPERRERRHPRKRSFAGGKGTLRHQKTTERFDKSPLQKVQLNIRSKKTQGRKKRGKGDLFERTIRGKSPPRAEAKGGVKNVFENPWKKIYAFDDPSGKRSLKGVSKRYRSRKTPPDKLEEKSFRQQRAHLKRENKSEVQKKVGAPKIAAVEKMITTVREDENESVEERGSALVVGADDQSKRSDKNGRSNGPSREKKKH